jgi:hypothetical protein
MILKVRSPATQLTFLIQRQLDTSMTKTVEQYISDLRQTINAAQLNFDIWWTYKSSETRPLYIDVLNRYPQFFQTSIHAHFVALLIALYRLYEKRDDTFNIPSLLRRLRDEGVIAIEKLDELEAMYIALKPRWIKVSILRSKAFGHRSNAHTVEEVFEEAAVTPNELRDLVTMTKDLLNTLTLAFDQSFHAFNASAERDLIQMLDDLKKVGGTGV